MSGKIPNVRVSALVPADFEQCAARLGYTAEEYLWLLAADARTNPRESGEFVIVESAAPTSRPANVVPFLRPAGEERSGHRPPIAERPGRQNYVAGDGTLRPIPRCPPR